MSELTINEKQRIEQIEYEILNDIEKIKRKLINEIDQTDNLNYLTEIYELIDKIIIEFDIQINEIYNKYNNKKKELWI